MGLASFRIFAGVEGAGHVLFQATRDAKLKLEFWFPQHDATVNLTAPTNVGFDDKILISLFRKKNVALALLVIFSDQDFILNSPKRIRFGNFPTPQILPVEA